MPDRLDEERARLDKFNEEADALELKVTEVLKSSPDQYTLVKFIGKLVWAGFQNFSGGWVAFLTAIGKELLNRVKGEKK